MKRPTRQQTERAAEALVRLMRFDGGRFTDTFLDTARWPKDYYPSERKEARELARAALTAALN